MLIELNIKNFALIENLRIEPDTAFNVLTGETGAGKSIIVDAMSAAIGERTGSEVVRTGTDKCLVEAIFDASDTPLALAAAIEQGVEAEEGLLILSREISKNGKSSCRLNGRTLTASDLRKITAHLIDIHGQHEHQSLLSVPVHIELFDLWCGEDISALKNEAVLIYEELSTVRSEQQRLQKNERERAKLLDLYNFQFNEISDANLNPAEEEELNIERSRLANAEKLFAAASVIYESLSADGAGIDCIGQAQGAAEKAAIMDSSLEPLIENLTSALVSAQEALAFTRDYKETVEANPLRLEQIEERLDLFRTLKRKYGETLQDIIDYADDLKIKLDELEHAEDISQRLSGKLDNLGKKMDETCTKLTALRKKHSIKFAKAVESELADLAMGKTRFEVKIEPTSAGPNGADAVEFMISSNPGEPLKPLAKIASGGEMSRISLALKTINKQSEITTMVFDEIDTGIGGRTAQVLGEKLAALGEKCQVLCVTHLPQIASKASRHYSINKVVNDGRSYVNLNYLDGENRVCEIARMLGAEDSSSAALMHAREMLLLANQGNSQAG